MRGLISVKEEKENIKINQIQELGKVHRFKKNLKKIGTFYVSYFYEISETVFSL